MQTEFTCGIYSASFNESGIHNKWFVKTNNTVIAIIDADGLMMQVTTKSYLTQDCLIEISVLMNNIKRQYKQLQTT